MAELDPFPLVAIDPVANGQNEWVALCLRIQPGANLAQELQAVFGTPDLLAAIAPLDGLLMLDHPAALTPPVLALTPANRIGFVVAASTLAEDGVARRLTELHELGYRLWLDGTPPAGVAVPPALRTIARDYRRDGLPPARPAALFGPHMVRGVDSVKAFADSEMAGFDWFSGDYPCDPATAGDTNDGTSRRRILTLLGLLSRDADSRELELQLKQDPALSYHLLKLVNSAAFAVSTQITSFNQAISLLGRRQLQRWLQLLLYARQHADGLPNLLLPLAARRGAQLEALCKDSGGDRDACDLAFMAGVFSLLDRLLHMPMADIVADLHLPEHVSGALLARSGQLGDWLRLTEAHPSRADLEAAGITPADWWNSQLNAYHWAIQVGRNV
ncbi:HDOD domain-containing protein [Massilia sp. IC2-476]|uniref:HDOD domain-containing protein n=1 Tax=Massilia sp. IC2-476 TaxID=2887199 RepID=UPI001D10ACDE|nr:HDOD domain-containing protein [Massilia sp. IC2-476]MCC2972198.1 HDOD domain-containing protein [Massilia sp. IC2-476]